MNSRQKNFILWSKTKQIVDTVNKYNLSPAIKKDAEIHQFILDETSHFPEKTSLSFRAIAVATENPCKCIREACGEVIGNPNKKYCSKKCHGEHIIEKMVTYEPEEIIHRIKVSNKITHEEYDAFLASGVAYQRGFVDTYNKVANLGYEELDELFGCDVDSNKSQVRSNRIMQLTAYVTRIATYRGVNSLYERMIEVQRYPDKTENMEFFTLIYGVDRAAERMRVKSDRVLGEKNPGYKHNGEFSPFSEKFVGGDVREETTKKAHQSRIDNNSYQTKLSYWTERCGEEEGQRLYYERQNTFSLDKLIDKYGVEEGTRRWAERQEKWQDTLKSLPESEKIRINAKKGFWRHTVKHTNDMDPEHPFNKMSTILYVIEYQPLGYDTSFVKFGVTSKYLSQRFPSKCIKNEFFIHKADRFTNFHIETEVKKYMLKNSLNILIESEDKKFDGWTECVPIEYKDKLMEIINESIRNNRKEI